MSYLLDSPSYNDLTHALKGSVERITLFKLPDCT